ncbi:PLU-1-like protein-domain-containing protein [Rhodofomes roseus]|uniref:[histone H3]-trimethyl-L-lysine(4) demethylase n=1 Tax=Rhodofomes roseus TaxID=34475 RepID=A0ABQ8K9K0_9APHY|nr:PLU-1-like protein-domain-containing protein [Rhodofomes roseus]KAH9833659.1 PLU-1-like protein-domain-containing protein [Rhodofomes roseus]
MHASPTPRGTPARRGRSPRASTNSPGASAMPVDIPNRPSTTFTSCLSIAVEGTTPIERPDAAAPSASTGEASQSYPSESKRAPRKSKTDAIAALHNHAQSNSDDAPDSVTEEGAVRINLRDGPPIRVTPFLDLTTVKTPDRSLNIPNATDRPFGLTDCPVFHPTPEQWKDPLGYIRSISDNAKKYGMCKIVPPAGWDMPFVTDTERFRFKTRLQCLNSIEASSRAKVNFLEQLYRYHKQQGNSRVTVPTINHKPLDLWSLRKEVQKLGGYDAVTRNKKWADLGRLLGYTGIPGLSTQMKNSYARVILPYELYRERVRNSPTLSPKKQGDPQLKTHAPGKAVKPTTGEDDVSEPSSPLTATSSPLSEPPEEASGRPRRNTRQSSLEHPGPRRATAANDDNLPFARSAASQADKDGNPELHCEVCLKKDRGEEMLLCDGCDCGFHMFCLDPPLNTIPKGQWFCHTCLMGTGGDFGFDEGEEHSLASFQARDREFRRLWFKSHRPASQLESDGDVKMTKKPDPNDPTVNVLDDVVVTETDVENEFWRLVQSQQETVEVEYGADVHSTTHGSGMPTLETHPLDPYSKDPWNLNNIPILSDSLLRYIKSDISGMTVPWTYVGMVFSTFCWHNEDHYTYSINYMHWGETKTWYSIPGDDAEKFEAAIRREAPDLFEVQPDLLFQLVTLMNPSRLKETGVDVYSCNQRAGEFVITFPKAYHAGFNHGFNFNEAVNFALSDWLPFGLDCVKRYQEHRKLAVFSHDELLITITQQNHSIQTALWLNDSLQEMMVREMRIRDKARSLQMGEVLEGMDRAEDQCQCTKCKVFCYLSQITCTCTTKVVCIDHIDDLCKCDPKSRILRKRFEDAELQEIQVKVSERAAVPGAWRAKLNKILTETARPSLRSLRAVLAEGDRINFHLPELHSLRKCVARANEWVDAANAFLVRKPSRKRPRKIRGPRSSSDSANGMNIIDDAPDRPEHSLDDLYAVLKEVENLGFDCQEIGFLRNLAKESEETKAKARVLLNTTPSPRDRDAYIQECDRLLLHGLSLNVLVEELLEVEKIVLREQLLKDLDEDLDESNGVLLEHVRGWVARARQCDLPPDNPFMKRLDRLLRLGDEWERRVKDLLTKPQRTIEQLEEFAHPGSGIPMNPDLLDRLLDARARAKDYEKQAKLWLSPEASTIKPKVQDAVKLVARADKDFNIPAVSDLKRTVDFAMDLETRCDAVLKHRYQHTDEGDIFQTMLQWRKYAKEHLTMFTLPNFERLDKQLSAHFRWLESLPWFCRQHQEVHAHNLMEDVIESTRPEDDLPPNDEYFTCICTTPVRPPAQGTVSDAVQCDHCFARFHGVCAANGGSCPFCDHHHWNGTIHKERNWHFCYLPTILLHAPEVTKNYSEEWKQLEIVVHRVDRLAGVIGQFLSFASQPANQRAEYIPQVRHYMRKLYKIQFAVSPNPEVSFGLDLAGLHRILAGQPVPVRIKKRRRPKFVFGQDVDPDWRDNTRCICRGRTSYLLNYPTVQCEVCEKLYHAGCVFFPVDSASGVRRFMCPLCCIRKNRSYPFSEVRVKYGESPDPDVYVNTKEMLQNFSKEMIYMKLPPPYTQTLFVELIRFTPGVPENSGGRRSPPAGQPVEEMLPRGLPLTNGSSSQAPHPRAPHPPVPHAHHHSHRSAPVPPPNPYENGKPIGIADPSSSRHVPPPPPWSNQIWSNAGATAPPPGARVHQDARSPHITSPHVGHTPPQSAAPRKRKYPDDVPPHTPDERLGPGFSPGPPKRRQASDTPQPAATTPRSNQGLSPSLAMMLSPGPNDIRTPPQSRAAPPSYSSRPIAPNALPAGASSRMVDDRLPRSHPHASPHAQPHTSPHVPHQNVRKLVYTEVHTDRAGEFGHGGHGSPPDDYRSIPPMHPRR